MLCVNTHLFVFLVSCKSAIVLYAFYSWEEESMEEELQESPNCQPHEFQKMRVNLAFPFFTDKALGGLYVFVFNC